MLGMNYLGEDYSESALAYLENTEGRFQAGLAAARCTEPGSVQETIQASLEARRGYVQPQARPPAGTDDFDERVINPCLAAMIASKPELDGFTPWEVRNVFPAIFDPIVTQARDLAAPVLAEFGDTPRARSILLDWARDNCIRGGRGEEPLSMSEAEVRELLSISQEPATQSMQQPHDRCPGSRSSSRTNPRRSVRDADPVPPRRMFQRGGVPSGLRLPDALRRDAAPARGR